MLAIPAPGAPHLCLVTPVLFEASSNPRFSPALPRASVCEWGHFSPFLVHLGSWS